MVPPSPLAQPIACPVCHGELTPQATPTEAQTVDCTRCGRRYPIVDGIAVLIPERAIPQT